MSLRPVAFALPLLGVLAACAPQESASPQECFNDPQFGEGCP